MQVRSLVGEALGSRYEESLLSAYLDSQADLTYCPRLQCQRPVVVDPVLPMAQCASCCFVFCLFCRMVYHGVQPCRLKPGWLHGLCPRPHPVPFSRPAGRGMSVGSWPLAKEPVT